MDFKELISILKRLYREYIKRYLKYIFFAAGLSVIVAANSSAIAWLLDPAVKKIFIEKDRTLAWLIPLAIIFTFTTKGVSLYLARINIIKVSNLISGEIQKKISDNMLTADIKTIDARHSGQFVANILFDAQQIQSLVGVGVLNIMKDTLTVLGLVGLMFYQNWKLAIFAILMIPLAAFLAKSLGRRVAKIVTQAGEIAGNLTSFLSEIIKGSKMIRIYQKEKEEGNKANKIIDNLVDKQIKHNIVIVRATPIMETLTGFMIAGFIFFSGKLISSGELEVNQFFSFLAAMMLAYQPIRSLATLNMIFYQGAAAFKRISKVIDKNIEIKNNSSLPELNLKNCNINFNNVSFKYETTNDRALKNLSLDIKGNAMSALVGTSGAGKSTIINLIPRFYDVQEGSIEIDGQKINSITLNSLRKNISLVSQDVILFDDTIRNNVAYANLNASDDEIKNACVSAAAEEFINKTPKKYDTIVGENGVRLSGGQKQRISIARAILKKSPIILLDEATSSLDTGSEEIVQNAIKNLTKNKTTIVIAHRLSTIHNADKIFVLQNGVLIDSGKHDHLINNCQEYKTLYEKQLK
ncbi:ABC transporter ATP-binding protein/permease [Candidatus Pelagibacter bacterium]|nr:ABC transporter ATP-binding protein/permease [Candidatus Pelagibacter bacterium]